MMSKLLNLPVNLIKGVRNWFVRLFRNLHLSMRRRITVAYLSIFVITSLITILFVPSIFIFFEIDESADEINQILNVYIESYMEGSYDADELGIKVEQIAISERISIKMDISEDGETERINTGVFLERDMPSNPLEFLSPIFKEGLVAKRVADFTIDNEELARQVNFNIGAYYPIRLFADKIITLAALLLIFQGIGYVFMSTLGGQRVKTVLSPIYYMTKTADQISISNLNLRLDVETTKYELKDLAMTLNEMLDRLDKDYNKQRRFVSDVSHELRTPISIINGYASMLERWGKKDEEILEESIDAIKSESVNMQQLVENLLTLVRSDNQTLKYEPSEFNIDELICNIVKEFNMVNTKNQYITCESKGSVKVWLDEAKIKQSLRIFVDNAVKYTPEDGSVQVKCYQVKDMVYIHIKDSGIGISKEDLPYLFDRFYRSDESRTRETGGHGLGLAIAKVIIIGHNGKIKVKSRLGKGSEFIISLPVSI